MADTTFPKRWALSTRDTVQEVMVIGRTDALSRVLVECEGSRLWVPPQYLYVSRHEALGVLVDRLRGKVLDAEERLARLRQQHNDAVKAWAVESLVKEAR